MELELVPLCTATVTLAETINVSSSLVIAEVVDLEVTGERLRGHLHGRASADWLQLSPLGFGIVDVKMTIETDDGALVLVTYGGRLQLETVTAYTAPTFHTGDERYAWLNGIQAAAKGTFDPSGKLVYEIFELR